VRRVEKGKGVDYIRKLSGLSCVEEHKRGLIGSKDISDRIESELRGGPHMVQC